MAIRTIPDSGAVQSYVRTRCEAIQRIPDDMSLPDAATIPWNFCPAHHCLVVVAQLQPGEAVVRPS